MRSTRQRECIFEVLSSSECALSPEELLHECQKEIPSLGIATIHRELKRLRENGEIEEVKLPHDVIRFCTSTKGHHHHFKCNSCDRVYDIKCHNVEQPLPKGFKTKGHEVNISGVCAHCSH